MLNIALINQKVYYNELNAGVHNYENDSRNRGYKNLVKIANIKYAMIEQLRSSDPVFKDVIKMYFYLNKHEILKKCQEWIQDSNSSNEMNTKYDSIVKTHNIAPATRYNSNCSLYSKDLVDIVNDLKQELDAIDITTLAQYEQYREKFIQLQDNQALEENQNNQNSNSTQSGKIIYQNNMNKKLYQYNQKEQMNNQENKNDDDSSQENKRDLTFIDPLDNVINKIPHQRDLAYQSVIR